MHILKTLYLALITFLFPQQIQTEQMLRLQNGGLPACITTQRSEAGCVATTLSSYKDPIVKAALISLKFRRNKHAARLFATLLHDALLDSFSTTLPFQSVTYIIPIPLSPTRKRLRGFNQVETILDELVRLHPYMQAYITYDFLKRVDTETSQTTKTKQERLKALENAFVCPHALTDSHIYVIDDVLTTGTTLKRARDILLQSGAKSVDCIALTHA